MARHWDDDRRVRHALRDGEFLHLAVDTPDGPHLTPQVYARHGSELWVFTTRRSVKVRAIRRQRWVAALVADGSRAVMLTGVARVVDPLRGHRSVELPFVAGTYLSRNLGHALGIARAAGPDPTLLLERVALRIDPRRVALLDGSDVLQAWGRWPSGEDPDPTPGAFPSMAPGSAPSEVVPPRLRRLVEGDGRAVVGWPTAHGFAVLPAVWDADSSTVAVPGAALALCGGMPSGPASLTFDRGGTSLDSKRGVMVRGTGRVLRREGAWTHLAVRPDRVTWWRGERSRSVTTAASHLEDPPGVVANP